MLGNRLKIARKNLRLNQTEFANLVSTSVSYISEIEADKKIPSDKFLHYLSNETGINIDWLKTGEGEVFISPFVTMSKGERLKEIFKTLNLSREDVSTIINVPIETLLDCERDNIEGIPVDLVVGLAEKLHVNGNWFLNGVGDMFLSSKQGELIRLSINSLGNLSDTEDLGIIHLPYFHHMPDTPNKLNAKYAFTTKKAFKQLVSESEFIIRITNDDMKDFRVQTDDNIFVKKQDFLEKDGNIMLVYNKEKGMLLRQVFFSNDNTGYVLRSNTTGKNDFIIKSNAIIFVAKLIQSIIPFY